MKKTVKHNWMFKNKKSFLFRAHTEQTWFSLLQLVSIKQVEKLEVHVHELTIKIEELNRTIVDITSHKTRLSQVCLVTL
jgi:uncharacterized protein (DUF1015 family)